MPAVTITRSMPSRPADYHALLATLRSSRSVQRTIDHPEINRPAVDQLREMKTGIRDELVRVWKEEAAALTADRFEALATSMKDQAAAIDSPLRPWVSDALSVADRWRSVAAEVAKSDAERTEFNTANFTTLADFRQGLPAGGRTDGMGLRSGASQSADFVVAHEGEAALKGCSRAGCSRLPSRTASTGPCVRRLCSAHAPRLASRSSAVASP